MRKVLVLLAGLMMATTIAAPPASAITGDFVEDHDHPFVGLVAFYDTDGAYLQRCSGSLLSPTVFLTAGHCTSKETDAVTARVYLQQDAGADYDPELQVDLTTGYPEYCADGTLGTLCATSDGIYSYGWSMSGSLPDTRDAGLVVLDQPIRLEEYGELPGAGTLDELASRRGGQDLTFTSSGYGDTLVNPVKYTTYRERLMAETRLTNLRSHLNDGFNVQTNGNGRGRGGTCSGDSGGPLFLGGPESNLIVGITSFGLSTWCRGVDFSFRTDQQAVLDWIHDIVGAAAWAEIAPDAA
jgi:Trypsin